jgi:hypothetical protein
MPELVSLPSARAKGRFSASFCALTSEDSQSLAEIAREANISYRRNDYLQRKEILIFIIIIWKY